MSPSLRRSRAGRALKLALALALLSISIGSAVVLLSSASGHPPTTRIGAMIIPASFAAAFAFLLAAVVATIWSFRR
jgi:hypothetical protein